MTDPAVCSVRNLQTDDKDDNDKAFERTRSGCALFFEVSQSGVQLCSVAGLTRPSVGQVLNLAPTVATFALALSIGVTLHLASPRFLLSFG